jgi:hypothetical protein
MALALLSPAQDGGSQCSVRPEGGEKGLTMIRKVDGKYVVISETTGRRFGTYGTRAEAERRLRQIEFFKHLRSRSPRRRPVSSRSR